MVIREKRSQFASVASAAPSVPSLRVERKFTLQEAKASNKILTALEDGNVDDVRRLVSKLPEGVTSALNTPSLLVKHKLRTPLMAAARTGDLAKFSTILDAFDRQFEDKLSRDFEMRLQLANRDRDGMTAAMLAARSGCVPIVAELMTEIEDTESLLSLEARDHRHMTLLMHAASVGPAPVFHEVQEAIISSVRDYQDFALQLELRSSDDKNVLMHAASSGDAMLLKTVADACRKAIPPNKVRGMLVDRDSDGLNLLMHAASCQTIATASLPALVDVEGAGEAEDTQQGDGDDEEGGTEEDEEEATGENGTEGKGDKKTPGRKIKNITKKLKIAQGAGTVPAASTPPATSPPGNPKLGSPVGTTTATTATATTTTADVVIAAVAAGGAAVPLAKTGGVEAVAEAEAEEKAKAEALARPPVVPVFKIAFKLLTECLWKDKVLEQLKATDLWGRNVLTHALLSGHRLMFEAVLGAVRDVVSDEEVSEMLETNEGEREDEPMIDALDKGQTSMRKLFALRVGQIKKDVDARSKLSSIDAKIESFIPGKLVVMFQLLLPQIAIKNQLFLLYILCAIAPVLKLATSVAKKTGVSSKRAMVAARTGKLSIFLGAPAMFFWGIGTSDIGSTSVLNWSPALSATAMAVATICIPAVDAFFYSSSAARWGDKISCMEWRFHLKAYRRWFRARDKSAARLHKPAKSKRAQDVLPSYSTFGGNPASISSGLQGVEEGKHEPAPTTPVTGRGPSLVAPENRLTMQI